jgi:transcriptional regulator with GAF, ATPase, and Fis domain
MDFRFLQSVALRVGEALTLDDVFQRIVEGLAAQADVALARVWLVLPSDVSESSGMGPECPDEARCLHLVASAGTPVASAEDWSRLDGHFRRVPLGGAQKVGQIGASGEPVLVSNNLAESQWVVRPDWARRERIASFAGQPLVYRGDPLGVLAVFSRAEITPSESNWLRIFADHAAIAIANARAFDEVQRLRRQLELERDYLRDEVKEVLAFGTIVGQSAALRGVLEQVELVAATEATALIHGESGTGKELIAAAIHERSPRRDRPLVRVNCGSIPAELFESEFFGHVQGAFTGALRDRVGRFQHADGGTLFLDEIGEIPLAHQAKLLRVLQEGQFERVGDDRTRKVNVRIIAATNRDLRVEVAERRFRQDLFYRISVFPMQVPPLRQRPEDIPALAHHFVSLFSAQLNRPTVRLTNDDVQLLQQYDWPGNVRELQNVVERAIILARGSRLRLDLALAYGSALASAPDRATEVPPVSSPEKLIRNEELKRLERDSIIAALERAHRRISGPGGAAALLGVNPNTLTSRMRALGIKRTG